MVILRALRHLIFRQPGDKICRALVGVFLLLALPANAQVLNGAEIELPPNHLLPFVKYIDFQDLQNRYNKSNSPGAALAVLNEITNDLPLTHPKFLDLIPAELKLELLKGMTADGQMPEVQVVQPEPTRTRSGVSLILDSSGQSLETNPSIAASSDLIKPSQELVRPSQAEGPPKAPGIDNQLSSHFWQALKARWNSLDATYRLQVFPWTELPASHKARLISWLYIVNTHKDTKPKNPQQPDPINIRFNDERVRELYHRFYPAKDLYDITEFHTLYPSKIDAFLKELRAFLRFVGVEQKIMRPSLQQRNNVSLHVHVSSPQMISEGENALEELAFDLRRMLAVQTVNVRELPVLMSLDKATLAGHTLDSSMVARSLGRIEVRLFLDDVEKELRTINEICSQPPSVARRKVQNIIDKETNLNTLLTLARMKPTLFWMIYPFEAWKNLKFSVADIEKVFEILKPSETMLLLERLRCNPDLGQKPWNRMMQDLVVSAIQNIAKFEGTLDDLVIGRSNLELRRQYLLRVLFRIQSRLEPKTFNFLAHRLYSMAESSTQEDLSKIYYENRKSFQLQCRSLF